MHVEAEHDIIIRHRSDSRESTARRRKPMEARGGTFSDKARNANEVLKYVKFGC